MALTVSKLATEAGVRPDTVRYYERAGLLPPAARSTSGYRMYGEEAVDRLRFIKGVQSFGLRLREVRDLLEVMDRGLCPCGHTEGLVRSRITELDEEIGRLRDVRKRLVRLAEEFPAGACPDPGSGRWPCEEEFIRKGGEQSGT